uniref:PIG-H domain-containing protein n=1 Tax=Caenorhabditis tropicalis TaxID=1561998 RepID=A0A1I7TIC5_9PELO
MRSSSSKKIDQTRGAHRSKKVQRVNVEQVSTFNLKFKIYQVMLFLISVSMIYYWHKSFLLPKEDIEEIVMDADGNEVTGFIDLTLKKVARHAVLYFLMFITEPFNLTLIMVCLFSRIVLNFVTFHFTFTLSEIICKYEIDESYFVPITPTNVPVDV